MPYENAHPVEYWPWGLLATVGKRQSLVCAWLGSVLYQKVWPDDPRDCPRWVVWIDHSGSTVVSDITTTENKWSPHAV